MSQRKRRFNSYFCYPNTKKMSTPEPVSVLYDDYGIRVPSKPPSEAVSPSNHRSSSTFKIKSVLFVYITTIIETTLTRDQHEEDTAKLFQHKSCLCEVCIILI